MTIPDRDTERLCHLRDLGLEMSRFFDVGASNGCWSYRVSGEFPDARFDLFEPLAEEVPTYREGMERILGARPNFRLHRVALGEACGKTRLHIPAEVVGSTALEMPYVPPDWRSLEVEALTVDAVLEQLRLPPPHVLKVDTQGCELAVLKGARGALARIQVLLLECWLQRDYGPGTPLLLEVAEWLKPYHFYLWDLGEGCRNPSGNLVTQDCFFLNARSPVSPLAAEIPPPKERRFGRLARLFGGGG